MRVIQLSLSQYNNIWGFIAQENDIGLLEIVQVSGEKQRHTLLLENLSV